MQHVQSRRAALQCLGLGAGTLFALSGGVLTGVDLASKSLDSILSANQFLEQVDAEVP